MWWNSLLFFIFYYFTSFSSLTFVPSNGRAIFFKIRSSLTLCFSLSKEIIERQQRQQRQLVDDEKAKFKKKLRNSFEDINLPVIKEEYLKKRLITNKNSYFESFDRATGDVDLASEYKRSAREDLESFTSEEINKKLEKNRGGYLFFSLPFCSVIHIQVCNILCTCLHIRTNSSEKKRLF